jgi:hypothetical protein
MRYLIALLLSLASVTMLTPDDRVPVEWVRMWGG